MKFDFHNGGLFISRGRGRHETRVIDTFELIYVVSGTLSMFEGDRRFEAAAGDRLLLFPGRRHGGTKNYPRGLSFFWLHFLPGSAAARKFLADLPQCAPVPDPGFFSELCRLALVKQRSRTQGSSSAQKVLNPILEALLSDCTDSEKVLQETSGNRSLAESADRYLKLHFDESITTSGIAEELQCNPDYLNRVYHSVYGMTVGDAVRHARIARACRLLEETTLSVKETAYDAGFNDVSHFRRQFRRETSMTPLRYRRLHTAGHMNTQ